MTHKKLPFGYTICCGKIISDEAVYGPLQSIFTQYNSGASFQEISNHLKEMNIPYDDGRYWNKNIVARILEDKRYLGTEVFPQLIDPMLFEAVKIRRSRIASNTQQTECQKTLRKLCVNVSNPNSIEQEILKLINCMIRHPEFIESPGLSEPHNPAIQQLQHAYENAMKQSEVNTELLKQLIIKMTELRFSSISNIEYETLRLRQYLHELTPITELHSNTLMRILREVTQVDGVLYLTLKNGQTVCWRDFHA